MGRPKGYYYPPIEKIIEDNSVKDILDITDHAFLVHLEKAHMRNALSHDRVVPVPRKELLEKLKANREQHEQNYLEALKGYKEVVLANIESAREYLLDLHESVKEADKIKLVDLSKAIKQPHYPMNALEAYDEAIELFTWHVPEEGKPDIIKLEVGEFRNYILDKWDWQDRVRTANLGYTELARSLD